MTEGLRLRVGEAWAFRTRVEREAARRFHRLAEAIRTLDPDSPVVEMMRRAADDEVRHAALCAGLSEAYGRPAHDNDDAPDDRIAPEELDAREAILYEVVAACCITETESVATVATLLAEPAEPRIRAALHEIARDEVTHSRMGWAHLAREAPRGVAFLSEWIPVMLAGTVEPELFAPPDDDADDAGELLRHGVLPRSRKREIFVGTLEEVVFPGLDKLGVDAGPGRAWLAAASRPAAREV